MYKHIFINKYSKVFLACMFSFFALILTMSLLSPPAGIMSNGFKMEFAKAMHPFINSQTLYIIVNNLLVGLAMFLSSKIVLSLSKGSTIKEIHMLSIIIIGFYMFYFALQGIRVGVDLNSNIYINYWFSFFTLIFPHGIFELTGFALISSTSYFYHIGQLNKNQLIKMVIIASLIIVFAGLLETTLTPFIFKYFLVK